MENKILRRGIEPPHWLIVVGPKEDNSIQVKFIRREDGLAYWLVGVYAKSGYQLPELTAQALCLLEQSQAQTEETVQCL